MNATLVTLPSKNAGREVLLCNCVFISTKTTCKLVELTIFPVAKSLKFCTTALFYLLNSSNRGSYLEIFGKESLA